MPYNKENISHEEAIEKLNEVSKEFEDFTYITSHDLQAPLRSVVNFSKLLNDRHAGTFEDKDKKYFNYIINGSQKLQEMLAGLLTYSRLNCEEYNIIDTPFSPIVQEAQEACREVIESTGAVLHIQSPLPTVQCDSRRISALLRNLFKNAIKFQPDGQTPEIWLSFEIKGQNCKISVRDNGVGIDSNKLKEVFNVFRQLHPPTEYQGLGMGLAMSRKIINKHEGEIWAESKIGQGSTFHFTLKVVI